jgi:hypothetical protein
VTEAIKYNESHLLTEFFSVASPEMCSNDQSVLNPMLSEALAAREILELDDEVPLVKLQIPGAKGSPLYFITCVPRATPYMPPGCATHGGLAYDILQGTSVFLKDSWRVDVPDVQAEGLTYVILEEANVRNIPHCLASEDISTTEYHTTKTPKFAAASWACHSHTHFVPHQHCKGISVHSLTSPVSHHVYMYSP